MGLMSALKSRFFSPEICRVAKSGNVASIVECIAHTQLVVVAADLGNSVPLDADEQSVISMIHAATRKKRFDGDIHKYEIDGKAFLPVFTDRSTAELFCGAYCDLIGCIHAFRLFAIPGPYIRNWIADDDVIVVNPQSNNEVEFHHDHSQAIRDRLPGVDDYNEARFLSLALPMAGISQTIEFRPET